MHPIKQLQRTLIRTASQQGTVVKSESNQVFIATERGMKILTRSDSDATVYRNGDSVRFQGETLVGRRTQPKEIYVL